METDGAGIDFRPEKDEVLTLRVDPDYKEVARPMTSRPRTLVRGIGYGLAKPLGSEVVCRLASWRERLEPQRLKAGSVKFLSPD